MLLQIIDNPEGFIDIKTLILAIFAIAEAVVRLTPSEKDNSIINKIVMLGGYLLDFVIPNRSKRKGKRFKVKANEE